MKLPKTPPDWNPKPISPEEDFELREKERETNYANWQKQYCTINNQNQ